MNQLQNFTKGFIRENPILVLVLGTCPTLATTSSSLNGMGMGIATTFVLAGSNVVISMLANVIPDKVRIPAFVVIIASFRNNCGSRYAGLCTRSLCDSGNIHSSYCC